MKLAIIGSRGLHAENLDFYVPHEVTEVVSGGAVGVDSDAAAWARSRGIPLTELLPQYSRYGRGAPLKRDEEIAKYADEALVFWDGASKGTLYTINCFKRLGKAVHIVKVESIIPKNC